MCITVIYLYLSVLTFSSYMPLMHDIYLIIHFLDCFNEKYDLYFLCKQNKYNILYFDRLQRLFVVKVYFITRKYNENGRISHLIATHIFNCNFDLSFSVINGFISMKMKKIWCYRVKCCRFARSIRYIENVFYFENKYVNVWSIVNRLSFLLNNACQSTEVGL